MNPSSRWGIVRDQLGLGYVLPSSFSSRTTGLIRSTLPDDAVFTPSLYACGLEMLSKFIRGIWALDQE